jgi:hypothetical protein
MRACSRVAVAAIATFLLVPAAPSSAAWTNPFAVNNLNGDASSPSVGIDAAGNAIIAFQEAGGGLFLNERHADGTLGSVVPINNTPSGPPSTATNASGLTAIAWQQSDGANSRLHLRLRRANGLFTVDTIVSQASTNVFSPEVGIDDAGDAFVSWGANVGGVNRTFMRRKSSTGTLGVITSVSPTTGNNVQPHLAVEPGGRAYMTWIADGGPGNETVNGRARSTTGALSTPLTLSGAPAELVDDSVSLAGSGKALVAWEKTIGGEHRIQARTRSVTGSLTALKTLSSVGRAGNDADTAMGTVGDTGVVAWRRGVAGGHLYAQSRRIVAGVWQPVENVSPVGMDVTELRVGVDNDASHITTLFLTSESAGVHRVRARTRRPDGSYGAADIVSSDNGLPPSTPRLAVNASGQAAAAWRQQQNPNNGDLIWVGTNFL